MTFQEAMAATSRELNARATITCVDAFVISNTPLVSFSVEEGGQMTLGSVVSSRYTVSLPNSSGEWLKNGSILGNRSLTGARVQIQIGVYHDGAWDWQNAGLFIVEKTNAVEFGTALRLTGNDPLIMLDKVYDDQLAYRSTTTLGDILTHIKSKGITITGSLACNSSAIVNFQPDWGEEPTIREVLGYVLQMGGSFARCDRAGNITIAASNNATTHAVTTDKYMDFTDDERYFNFNRIKILPNGAKKDAAYVESYVTAAAESAANTLCLEGNPLFKTKTTTSYYKTSDTSIKNVRYYVRENNKYEVVEEPLETSLSLYYRASKSYNTATLQTMANALKTALTGMSFRAITIRWRGDPTVLIGDKVTITDTRGVSTTTVILQQSLRYEGGFSSEISCPLDLTAVYPSTITSGGKWSPPYFGAGTLDGSVIVQNSLTGANFADGSITNSAIKGGTITGTEIADSTITGSNIDASTFTNGFISGTAIDTSTFTNGSISGTAIDTSTFTNGSISGTAIDASTFTNGSISGTAITDSTMSDSVFSDGEINASKIDSSTFTNGSISGTAIDASTFTNGQISGTKINASTFTNGSISGTAINTSTFTNGSISGSVIDSSTLTNIPYAQIVDLNAETALFRTGVGDDLYLDRLVLNSANIGTATIGELMVRDAQGKLHKVLIGANGVVSSTEVQMDGQNLSNNAMMQVSQRLVWRQATPPPAPFIGMIWMDTSATPVSGEAKEILKRCTAVSPLTWEIVQSNELHTNVIDVDDNGMTVLTGGELNVIGGSVKIKSLDGAANIINMDSTGLTLSSTGQLKLQSTDSIIIGGSPFSVGGVNHFGQATQVVPLTGTPTITRNHASTPYGFYCLISTVAPDSIRIKDVIKSNGLWTVSFDLQHLYVGTRSFYVDACDNDSQSVTAVGGGVWERKSVTFNVTSYTEGNPDKNSVNIRDISVAAHLYFRNIKIEKGTTATDWSPSPQDTVDALGGLQTQIDGKIDTYFGTSDPSTGWTAAQKLSATGDMWYNSTAKKLKRWNGTSWDNITDQTAIDAYNTASTAKDTADGKRRVFTVTPPTLPAPPYDIGDLWVQGNSGQGNSGDIMRCQSAKILGDTASLSHWVKASKYTDDSGLTNFISNTYNPAIASKTTVFYGATKPTYTAVGDIWYESANGGIYRCTNISTQAHTEITSVALKQALSAATAAQTTANGKINTFVGSSTPTALAAGDLWMDTGNKNIWKRATAAGTGGWVQYLTAAGYVITSGMTIDGDDLTLTGTGNLNLTAGANLNVQANGNLNVFNGGDIEIENGGNLNVMSGGKINVSATDLLISGKTVETYASDKIKWEVSVGGTNLIRNSGNQTDKQGWGIWSPSGSTQLGVYHDTTNDIRQLLLYQVEPRSTVMTSQIKHFFASDDDYTISFVYGGTPPSSVKVCDINEANVVINFGAPTIVKQILSGYYLCQATAKVTGAQNAPVLQIVYNSSFTSGSLAWLKLEKGNKATDWSPAPEDPASGVKTASITIGDGGIDLTASDKITVNGGEFIATKANSITQTATNSIVSTVKSDSDWLGKAAADAKYSTITQTNDSIKLAVTSQSANLFPSDPSNWIQGTILGADGSNAASTTRIRSAGYITLNAGILYTVSRVKSLTGQIYLHYFDNSNAYIGNIGAWVTTYPYSFSLPSGATKIQVVVRTAADGTIVPTDVPGILFSIVPAGVSGGVKTSYIDIASDHIDIASSGNVSIAAGANFNVRAGAGKTNIGISNNAADNYFMWAGHGTPSSAPFSVKMDGSVKATKIQHEMPYTFWDMADASVPAEFPIYIPADYTIDSVTFTFQTKKARTFAKTSATTSDSTLDTAPGSSAETGEGTGNTGGNNSTNTGNTSGGSNTVASHWHFFPHTHQIGTHTHGIGDHAHAYEIPGHGHGINYGINEKSTLATSCALKIGATTIGTYSPNPSDPVEIRTYLSAGWNTVIVAPNNDARIVAFALVKLTPA